MNLQKVLEDNRFRIKKQQDNKLMNKTKEIMEFISQTHNERIQKKLKTHSPFAIVANAFNMRSQIQVSKLFNELSNDFSHRIPLLKQNCLVEFIKQQWHEAKDKLKTYKYFCQFHASNESYNLVLYGEDTPISQCCKQLVCFQFCKDSGSVKVLCLDPLCHFNPLEQRPISPQIFATIFNTPNSISTREIEMLLLNGKDGNTNS